MSTKLKNKFKDLITIENPTDQAIHDSKILMFKFLSIIEQEMESKGMNKKDLAKSLGTSPSYITQLFRGTKTVNLIKLAQMEQLFDLEFTIGIQLNQEKANSLGSSMDKRKKRTLVQ